MRDCMMALHQRFCKAPECREVREAEQNLRQALDRRGQEQLLKLADLENELLDETSLESFLSGFKLALGDRGGAARKQARERQCGNRNHPKRKDGCWKGGTPRVWPGRQADHQDTGQDPGGSEIQTVRCIAENQQLDVSRSGEYTVQNGCGCGSSCTQNPASAPLPQVLQRGIEQYTVPRIGAIKLNKLTSREIQKLYKDLLENGRLRKKQRKKHPGLSGSTVRGVHIMLHSALDRAVKERLLIRNPADGCVVPKAQHQEMKTLRPEDLKLSGCGGTAECPGYVLSGVGQRDSER